MTDIDDLINSLRMIGEEEMYQEPGSTSATINRAADVISVLRDNLEYARDLLRIRSVIVDEIDNLLATTKTEKDGE